MTTETTPTAGTTEPAAAASPTIDTGADVSGAVARQRARIEAAGKPEGTAEPAAAGAPTGEPATTGDVIDIEVPDADALIAEARRIKAEREQRAPVDGMARELAAVKAQLAAMPGAHAITAAVQAKDPAAFAAAIRGLGIDPALVQQLATKAQLGPSPADQLGAVIDAKLAPVLELVKGLQPQQAQAARTPADVAAARAGATEAYVGFIEGSGTLYPLQAALGEAAGAVAMHYLDGLVREGVDTRRLTDAQICVMVEKYLASRSTGRQPPGAPTIASGETNTQPSGAPTASGGPPKTTSAPRSVTNGLAASAAPPRAPANDEEAYRLAVERQRARIKSA